MQAPLEERVWIWQLKDGRLWNDELGLSLPWMPFMGTLAVAPDLEAITTLAPGPFGGNMDVPDVCPGNTVYLPVWNEGALFYTGDAAGALAQVNAVRAFRKRVHSEGGLHWTFTSTEDFQALAELHLTRHIQRWLDKNGNQWRSVRDRRHADYAEVDERGITTY